MVRKYREAPPQPPKCKFHETCTTTEKVAENMLLDLVHTLPEIGNSKYYAALVAFAVVVVGGIVICCCCMRCRRKNNRNEQAPLDLSINKKNDLQILSTKNEQSENLLDNNQIDKQETKTISYDFYKEFKNQEKSFEQASLSKSLEKEENNKYSNTNQAALKTLNNHENKPLDKPISKTLKPFENIDGKPLVQSPQKQVENKDVEPLDKPISKPIDTQDSKPLVQSPSKQVENKDGKPLDKPTSKPLDMNDNKPLVQSPPKPFANNEGITKRLSNEDKNLENNKLDERTNQIFTSPTIQLTVSKPLDKQVLQGLINPDVTIPKPFIKPVVSSIKVEARKEKPSTEDLLEEDAQVENQFVKLNSQPSVGRAIAKPLRCFSERTHPIKHLDHKKPHQETIRPSPSPSPSPVPTQKLRNLPSSLAKNTNFTMTEVNEIHYEPVRRVSSQPIEPFTPQPGISMYQQCLNRYQTKKQEEECDASAIAAARGRPGVIRPRDLVVIERANLTSLQKIHDRKHHK